MSIEIHDNSREFLAALDTALLRGLLPLYQEINQ